MKGISEPNNRPNDDTNFDTDLLSISNSLVGVCDTNFDTNHNTNLSSVSNGLEYIDNTNIHTNNHTHKDSIYKGLKGVDHTYIHTDFKYIVPGAIDHIRPSKNRVSENISCEIIS